MKIAAHPLIVAAALGLLGPAALVEDERDDDRGCVAGACDLGAAEVDAPSAEDFARVEAEWQAAVIRLDSAHDLAVQG